MLDRILLRGDTMHAVASNAGETAQEPVKPKIETHKHRDSGEEITGIRLMPGDVIRKGDKYDCPKTKRWISDPRFDGGEIKESNSSVWVHPVADL